MWRGKDNERNNTSFKTNFNGLVMKLVAHARLKISWAEMPVSVRLRPRPQTYVMKKQDSKEKKIKHSEEYIEFLKKRLASENYKASVTKEEYDKTKAKLDKEKFLLKMLKES